MPFDNPPQPSGDAHILREARHLIATKNRWIKERYEDEQGRRCAVAALDWACDTFDRAARLGPPPMGPPISHSTGTRKRLRHIVHRQLPWRFRVFRFICKKRGTIILFNDHPGTEHRHMMQLFDRAITRAEQKQTVGG